MNLNSEHAMHDVTSDSPRLVSPWRVWTVTAVILAVAVIIVLMSYRSFFTGLSAEACGYAQLSRNIAQGQGFQSSSLPPLGFMIWRSPEITPDLMRPPLYAAFEAGMFKLFSAWDRTALLSSAVWMLVLVTLILLFGHQIADREVCITSSLLLVLWPPICITLGLSAMPFSMSSVWWLLAWILVCRVPKDPKASIGGSGPHIRYALIGLCLALCLLTQTSLWLGCAVILAYMVITQRRPGVARWGTSVVTMLIVLLPWIVRQISVAHAPFYSLSIYETLMETPSYPDDLLYRHFSPGQILPWWPTNWPDLLAVLAKWLRNMGAVGQQNAILMILVPMALLGAFYNNSVKRMRFWLASVGIVVVSVCIYAFGRKACASTAVIPYLPMLMLMSVQGVRQLCEIYDENGLRRFRAVSIALVCICLGYTMANIGLNHVPGESSLRVGLYRVGEQITRWELNQNIATSCLRDDEVANTDAIVKALSSPRNALEHSLTKRVSPQLRQALKLLPRDKQHRLIVAILSDSIKGGTPLQQTATKAGIKVAPMHSRANEGTELAWTNRRIIEAYWPQSITKRAIPQPTRSIGFCDQADIAAWYTNTAWVWLPESPVVQAVDPQTDTPGSDRQLREQADESMLRELAATKARYLVLTPEVITLATKQMQGWFSTYVGASGFIRFRASLTVNEQLKLDAMWKQQRGMPIIPQFTVQCQPEVHTDKADSSALLPYIVVSTTDIKTIGAGARNLAGKKATR